MGENPRSYAHDRHTVETHTWMSSEEYNMRLEQTGAEIHNSLQTVTDAVQAYAAAGKLPLQLHTRRRNVWHTFEIESIHPSDGDKSEPWFNFLHAASEMNNDRSIFVDADGVGIQFYSSSEYDPAEAHQP